MSKQSVIIIGASGHGKVVADVIQKSGDIVKGFLDDNPELPATFLQFPILGRTEDYCHYTDNTFIIAIGDASIREKKAIEMDGVKWYTAIHPQAIVSSIDVSIGDGSVIMAGAIINPGTKIGRHCIINSGAVVEHDNIIGDFSHISVGVKLAGTVSVGKKTWIGIGASVINNIEICEDCIIGAGAVVISDIPEPGVYVGIPAIRR